MIDLEVSCPFCGMDSTVSVTDKSYIEWINGALVQDAFPYLSAEDREILISGLCADYQAKIFGGR